MCFHVCLCVSVSILLAMHGVCVCVCVRVLVFVRAPYAVAVAAVVVRRLLLYNYCDIIYGTTSFNAGFALTYLETMQVLFSTAIYIYMYGFIII